MAPSDRGFENWNASLPGRQEERYDTTLVVQLEGGQGLARNVSISGIYFETELPMRIGAAVKFTLDFVDSPGGPVRMHCEARVVRVVRAEGRFNVGAAIRSLRFERLAVDMTDREIL